MPTAANPVIPGCHPDPSVCRVGDDFYLVTSTFEYWPGLPIFHSRDLVSWTLIGHAIDRPDQMDLGTVPSSGGLFAATIRFHEGLFFLTCTLVHGRGRRGNFVLTASDPAGPWSDPLWLDGAPGIDPSLFFDDDGRSWLTTARLADPGAWPGQTDIWLREIVFEPAAPADPRGAGHRDDGRTPHPSREVDPGVSPAVSARFVGEEHLIWRGAVTGAVWAEGPHLYRVDGRYILLASEGGTEHDHAVSVAAAARVSGPYIGNPRNPVLTHRHLGRAFPVTGVGHADLVRGADDSWWALALGTRPVQPSGAQPLGRETFLTPVVWEDGWPVFAPGLGHLPHVVDDPGRGPTSSDVPWSFVRTTRERRVDVSTNDPQRLDLHPRPVSLSDVGAPTFAGRRQQHHRAVFRATFALWTDPAVRAGLAVRQSESNWVSLTLRPLRPEGATPDGATPDGATSDGATSDGAASERATSDGATSNGATPDGATSDGAASERATSAEATSDGATSERATSDEATSDGATSDGALMIVELRRCRDGVESVLGSALLRPPTSAARASCELAVAARDGHYEFSIAPAHAPAPALAPAPIEPLRAVDPAPACAQHSSTLPLNEPFSLNEPLPLNEPVPLGEPHSLDEPVPLNEPHSLDEPLPLNEPHSLDEPLPLGEPLSLGELDGAFLTSPLAGGFLGVWLGVFADHEHAGLDTPSPPVRVSGAAYAPTDGMLPHPRGAPRTGMPSPRY